jgi:hypothetical protein
MLDESGGSAARAAIGPRRPHGRVSSMGSLIAVITAPPVGELETSGEGSSPTDEQMSEEQASRDETIARLRPYLESLPQVPPHRMGNVTDVQLLGNNTWSNLNRYVVILTVDIGDPGVEAALLGVLPAGSTVEVFSDYALIDEWHEAAPDAE